MADYPAVRHSGPHLKLWVIIYAIGAAQAALLVLALWRRSANPVANRVLAVWIAIVGADLAVKALYLATPTPGLFNAWRFVALFPFLYGSLFYLYVRTLTTGRSLHWRDLMHLAGFALALALVSRWPRSTGWFDPFLFTYSLSYVLAALVRLYRYRRELRQRRSDADRMSLRWIEAMAVAQLMIWCIAAAHGLVQLPGVDYYLIYGVVAAWICVVGWFSLGQPPVADPEEIAPDGTDPDEPRANAESAVDAPPTNDDPRYPEVEARLSQLMERDALYREPALTIGQLAKRSGYPEYLVSAVINRRLGGNFWDYINRQRVEAVRVCLADHDDARSILDIAYASGFTAKSTFNAAFKRQVGETPGSYRRRCAEGSR